MLKLVSDIKFKENPHKNDFQKKLSSDIKNTIKGSNELLIKADRTSNFYRMKPDNYDKLLHNNVTKTNKKIDNNIEASIERKSKSIAEELELDDRIEITAKKEPFITLKDHKPNFDTNPKGRLINPTKSEIGKISKQTLDRINKRVMEKTKTNLWRNTREVIKWFQAIENKSTYRFISFDVVEYYPSITEELLEKALAFASQFDTISQEERDIIMHAKRSCLYANGSAWGKNNSHELFDVTMGSWDGAETCELVGGYILSLIRAKHGNNIGLYRDDGLGAFQASPQEVEKIKKSLCKIFQENGLKITVEANLDTVNFLDVTLDLPRNSFAPYSKPNNTTTYVHAQSNHPPNILENIPVAINKRLSELKSNETIFNDAKPPYQDALRKSGYHHELKYEQERKERTKKNRARKITWFNPPFSSNVKTNVGKAFIKIVKQSFPPEHQLRKLFNTNTLKLSYSCMPNVQNIIAGHNKKIHNGNNSSSNTDHANGNGISSNNRKDMKTCNCRKPNECPMNGFCLSKSVIYRATVTTDEPNPNTETYIGLTKNEFKERYNGHKSTFNNSNKRNSTELSKHIWQLKDEKKKLQYNVGNFKHRKTLR